MSDITLTLDNEAAALFEQLQGIDTSYGKNRMAENFQEEARRREAAIGRIVALLDLLGTCLIASKISQKYIEALFAHMAALRELATTPRLVVRYCGTPQPADNGRQVDYDIAMPPLRFSGTDLDALARRGGPDGARVAETATRAFTVLFRNGVQTLYLNLPGKETLQERQMGLALQVIAGFRAASDAGAAIPVTCGRQDARFPVICDEQGVPDENLTLLTAINGVTAASMSSVVGKIAAKRLQERYLNVYNAIFSVKSLKAKLAKTPLEVNNLLWLVPEGAAAAATPEQAGVTRLAAAMSKGAPMATASAVQAVYGDDYDRVDADHLGQRLQASSGLLEAAARTPTSSALEKEILTNIAERLDQVQDQVFDDLFSARKLAAFGGEKRGGFFAGLHERVRSMVTFYKHRLDTNKKMRQIVSGDVALTPEEYETLAKDYSITREDVDTLLSLLRACFDADGRFVKGKFAQAIPEFKRYEEKILEFLWNYLMDCVHEKDRIAFLNALQLLIARMQQPKRALGMLLADFCRALDKVKHSDAKALMLCSLLIQKTDTVLVNVEVTPEEILQVDTGLNRAVAGYAAWKVDQAQQQIFEKIQTIHQQAIAGLNQSGMDSHGVSPLYLLEIEREAYIFLALVGGLTARSVILSAVKEYGDPEAIIHEGKKRREIRGALTRNLRVAVRALGRVGCREDLAVLDEIERNGLALMGLERSPGHQEQIKRIIEWAAHSARAISDAA